MTLFRTYPVGDSCVCWSLGTVIDAGISSDVLSAYRVLKNTLSLEPGFRDLVPSYTALALHYDPMTSDIKALKQIIEQTLVTVLTEKTAGRELRRPKEWLVKVRYGGYDLGRLARLNDLTSAEVIERHTRPTYTVAMIGFIPHFPYLIGLDKRLETPRLESPRTRVPAGAVAIGGAQTGIYPSESPGGWNIIGVTDPLAIMGLEPGHTLRFYQEQTDDQSQL